MQSGESYMTKNYIKKNFRPSPTPRQSLTSSKSSSSVTPSESSFKRHSQSRRSVYRAELVQNDSFDNFSTCSSLESAETMRSHSQRSAASKDDRPFSYNSVFTTDGYQWIVKADEKNKCFQQSRTAFGVDLSCSQSQRAEMCEKNDPRSMQRKGLQGKITNSLDNILNARKQVTNIHKVTNDSPSKCTNNTSCTLHALTQRGTKKLTRTNSAGELTLYNTESPKQLADENDKILKRSRFKSEVSDSSRSSSSHSSLVPWQGSTECLLEKEYKGRCHSFAQGLPQDTMLDRVLRCFEAFNVLRSRDILLASQRQVEPGLSTHHQDNKGGLTDEIWRQCHQGTDNWKPGLFFKDFSLEEKHFPESEQGSVCSAADQNRLFSDLSISSLDLRTLSPTLSHVQSMASPDLYTARYVADLPSPTQCDQEYIITPPEEFVGDCSSGKANKRLTQVIAGTEDDCGSSTVSNPTRSALRELDLKPLEPSEIPEGGFRLITESEYRRGVKNSEINEPISLPLSDNISSTVSPECSLTNLEHPSRAAYLRSLLTEGQDIETVNSKDNMTVISSETANFKNNSTVISSELFPSVKPLTSGIQKKFVSEKRSDTLVSQNDSENKKVPSEKLLEECRNNIDYENYSHLKNGMDKDISEGTLMGKLEKRTTNKKKTKSLFSKACHEDENSVNKIKSRHSVSEVISESEVSTGSSGSPPPVDFATHPLSLTTNSAEETVEVDQNICNQKESAIDFDNHSPPSKSDNRFLSLEEHNRFLLKKMYPDSDSGESEDEANSPTDSKDFSKSPDSEKSEEVELFINNPESMMVGRLEIPIKADTYEELLKELKCKQLSRDFRKSSSNLKLDDIVEVSDTSSLPSPSDGWGIGAKPAVSEELLRLDGEEFVEYLGAIVKENDSLQPWDSVPDEVNNELSNYFQTKSESCPLNDVSKMETERKMTSCEFLERDKTENPAENKPIITVNMVIEAASSLKTTRPYFLPKEDPERTEKREYESLFSSGESFPKDFHTRNFPHANETNNMANETSKNNISLVEAVGDRTVDSPKAVESGGKQTNTRPKWKKEQVSLYHDSEYETKVQFEPNKTPRIVSLQMKLKSSSLDEKIPEEGNVHSAPSKDALLTSVEKDCTFSKVSEGMPHISKDLEIADFLDKDYCKYSLLVNKATRITANSSSLIDLIITNTPSFIVHHDVLPCPVGDHELLIATVNVRKEKRPPIVKTFRSLENCSQNCFCDILLNEYNILNSILSTYCVNYQVSISTGVFTRCLNECAPLTTKVMTRPPAPWIDSQLKEQMKRRDDLL
ncbi:hypothetical protein SK128_021174, partial [Halocaridina rubra]